MSLTDPKQTTAKPFADAFAEDEPFVLESARIVEVKNTAYGSGEMVLLTIQGQSEELSIWGVYLLAQIKDADRSDFGKRYKIIRKSVPGFADGREVKALVPAE